MLFNVCCVITSYYWKVVVGRRTQLEYEKIVETQFCDTVPHLLRSDPRVRQRIWIGMFFFFLEVYYESIKREPKIRGINKCRSCFDLSEWTTLNFTSGLKIFQPTSKVSKVLSRWGGGWIVKGG